MDDVEELGNALHLVEDDDFARRSLRDFRTARGPGDERSMDIRLEQIDEKRFGKILPQPGRFPRSAWAEQEEAPLRGADKSTRSFYFESQNGDINSKMADIPS